MNEETLFHLARALPPDKRAAFLDDACAGASAQRLRLEVLLRAHDDSDSFLDRSEGIADVAATLDSEDLQSLQPESTRGAQTVAPEGHPPAGLAAGTKVRYFGDYELLEEIARGGMGVVYKARQVSLNRIVAVKMILAGQLASAAEVTRFRSEAQTAANLQHPNIVAIHEVGEHDGQHYFSMDYVEGHSLAELVREAPLPPRRAARYVQIAAEAIHYAHQQGTLHRDLKPSNVLIDPFDQPRVTDFGLARRIDAEKGLTASGAVLGTPGYMPPEQASADRGKLGPASDVYSLGAVLYELVTGRPPFRAATPIDTIMQVLQDEPAAPRLVNPQIDRDLETIILKCLTKGQAQRYATAQELASDLQAFLDGRPVKARRPGPAERAVRWLRRQSRSVALAAVAAAVMGVVLVAGFLGRLWYREQQLGYLSLDTDAVALVADVLDEHGQPVVPRVGIPTEEPVALPAGSYRLRVSGRRVLSQDFQVLVERRNSYSLRVGLDERQLWEPLRVPHTFEVADFEGRADLILLSRKGMSRVNGATREVVWEAILDPKTQPALGDMRWDWQATPLNSYVDWTPRLLKPTADFDGDGTPDLVWALRHEAALLAVSGKDGRVLWCYRAQLPPKAEGGKAAGGKGAAPVQSTVSGLPALADVDGDGIPDFIAAFASASLSNPKGAQRWIEAISGRSGKSLWRRQLDDAWFAQPAPEELSIDCRWFVGTSGGIGYSGDTLRSWGDEVHRGKGSYRLSGTGVLVPFPPQVARFGPKTLIVFVAGTRLVGLDLQSGEPAWPAYDIGFLPARAPQFVDLDGDQAPEALLLRSLPASQRDELGASELVVVSLPTGKLLWRTRVEAEWGAYMHPEDEPPSWPIVVDLDGDGRPEVVVPHSELINSKHFGQFHNGGVAVLNGTDGRLRWQTTWKTLHDQVARLVVGPDIDGDGHRDVFVASMAVARAGERQRLSLFVDALSGKDGHTVWSSGQPLPRDSASSSGLGIGPLLWWQRGSDGWPQLVVPYAPRQTNATPALFVLSASTGQQAHVGTDLQNPVVADLDGDGTADLLTSRRRWGGPDAGIELSAIRGSQPEFWRKWGTDWAPAADLNGDGVADLLGLSGGKTVAVSGQDGAILWQSSAGADCWPGSGYRPVSLPLPYGDLDGDGVPDLLLVRSGRTDYHPSHYPPTPLLKALSGKDGRVLWTSDLKVYRCVEVQTVECRDLDGDGRPEVLITAAGTWDSADAGIQLRLAVLSGQDGKIRWQQALSDRVESWGGVGWRTYPHGRTWQGWSDPWWQQKLDGLLKSPMRIHPGLADLDGDGILDLVVPAVTSETGCELRALSGRDGRLLWQRSLAPRENNHYLLSGFPIPAIGDLDGDGKPEVAVLDYVFKPGTDPKTAVTKDCQVLVLNGADGKLKWSWQEEVFAGSGRVGHRLSLQEEQSFKVNNRPRPLLIRLDRADKPELGVCVWEWGSTGSVSFEDYSGSSSRPAAASPGKIIVLDAQGREFRRWSVTRASSGDSSFGVWNHDLDGDGTDELVFVNEEKLVAVSPAAKRTVWEWPLIGTSGRVESIQPAGEGFPATVVVRSGDGLYGLSGPTGKPRWRSEPFSGPLSRVVSMALLQTDDRNGLPRVLYNLTNQTMVCRQVAATEPTVPPALRPGAVSTAKPLSDDPRRRHFSWHASPLPGLNSPADSTYQVVLAFLLVVLPGFLVLRWVRKRAVRPSRLLAGAALLAVLFGLSRAVIPDVVPAPARLFRIFMDSLEHGVLFGVVLIAFPGAMGLWIATGRWRRALLLLALYVGICVLVAEGAVGPMQDWATWDPRDWTSWYFVLIGAACYTGVATLLICGVLGGDCRPAALAALRFSRYSDSRAALFWSY